MYVKNISEQKKRITFCEQKEIKHIYPTHLGEKYFKPLQNFNKIRKTSIQITFLNIDFSLQEITQASDKAVKSGSIVAKIKEILTNALRVL